MLKLPLVVLTCALGLFLDCAGAQETTVLPWPQFRGISGQGELGSVPLPTRWSESAGICWKTELPGQGHSSPVHDGTSAWLTAAEQNGKHLFVVSVELSSGQIGAPISVFQPSEVVEIHSHNSHASPSPVLSDGKLVVHFGTYGTACIETSSRQVLWRNTSFPLVHDAGPGSSPVIWKDLVILTLDGADTQRVVALDLATGEVRWERCRTAPMPESTIMHRSFCTPLVASVAGGRPQLISPGPCQCHAYDPETGEEIWHVRYDGFSVVPRPVVSGSTCYFCTGYMKPQLWAVDMTGSGDVTESHVRWKFRGPVPEIPSPIVADGLVFIMSNTGVLTAIDSETGVRKWHSRVGGNHSASPLLANGLLYFCSEEGTVKLFNPRGTPKVTGINRMDGQIKASPAVIDRDLLIRTDRALYRIRGTELSSR